MKVVHFPSVTTANSTLRILPSELGNTLLISPIGREFRGASWSCIRTKSPVCRFLRLPCHFDRICSSWRYSVLHLRQNSSANPWISFQWDFNVSFAPYKGKGFTSDEVFKKFLSCSRSVFLQWTNGRTSLSLSGSIKEWSSSLRNSFEVSIFGPWIQILFGRSEASIDLVARSAGFCTDGGAWTDNRREKR